MGAPYPPVPNTIRFRLQGSGSGEIWENVLYYQYSGVRPTISSMDALCNSVAAQFAGQMAPMMHTATALEQVNGVDLTDLNGVEGTAVLHTPGTRVGGTLPLSTSMLVSYPVAARWKGGHPRSYLVVGADADLLDAMHWVTTFVNGVAAAWNTFLSNVTGLTSGGTTLSGHVTVRYHGKFLTNNGPPHYVLATPIPYQIAANTAFAHAQLSTQKGRIGRRRK
jgi:hypothetical protein